MIDIRYVQAEDKEFWYSLDKHLPKQEVNKIAARWPAKAVAQFFYFF